MLKKPERIHLKPEDWGEATKLVRGGLDRSHHGETAEALYLTSGFVYPDGETAERRFAGEDDGYVYARYGNPTVSMFEERLRLLEGAEACYGVGSGMAAVWGALACQLKSGDHIVSSRALFGSCYQIIATILPRFGIASTLVDGQDLKQWKSAVRPETKVFFLETPSNPTLEIIDIAAVAEIAHAASATVVVDNVFATPVLQKCLGLGADIIVYSGTKHIDGQGRVLGGAIVSTKSFKDDLLKPFLRHTGPSLSPFNAWVLLKGLETLKLRVLAQCEAALNVAGAIQAMPGVVRVIYPFLDGQPQAALARRQMHAGGTMVTFEVEGGKARAFEALRRLQIIDISNNLGDAKSMMTHPASTTHRNIGAEARAAMGITDAMLRLSVGLEEPGDLIADLAQALSG
ncbi:MAG TPA: O-succinylhomoserine sulfhydrylase [Aestuariivirgaceae bacterium]|nr:O-succinylhomoserine sulfhydrylase [Aestuariivirgaceae bacterium]